MLPSHSPVKIISMTACLSEVRQQNNPKSWYSLHHLWLRWSLGVAEEFLYFHLSLICDRTESQMCCGTSPWTFVNWGRVAKCNSSNIILILKWHLNTVASFIKVGVFCYHRGLCRLCSWCDHWRRPLFRKSSNSLQFYPFVSLTLAWTPWKVY